MIQKALIDATRERAHNGAMACEWPSWDPPCHQGGPRHWLMHPNH
jgi:hypothetical protein